MNKKRIICCLMMVMLLLSVILQIFPLSNIVKADDITPPSIIINFAGNLSDSGGPYWRPPGETDILDEAGEGVWRNGYYTSSSMQHEDYIYINLTVTDAESSVTNVWLQWLNGTTWTNYTYAFVHLGAYWTYTTSGNIQTCEGYDYSFNIVANSTGGSSVIWWNKTGLGGSYTRRYVQLNCTPVNISYTPFYTYKSTYSSGDVGKKDRMQYDGGLDGTTFDTGYISSDIPSSEVSLIWCSLYTGNWFEDDVCISPFTMKNVYYHIWVTEFGDDTYSVTIGWKKTRDRLLNERTNSYVETYDENKSTILYNGYGVEKYGLSCNLLDITDTPFTDNNIYEFSIRTTADDSPATISNRSFTSFVLFNVPSDITSGADTTTDTDSDSINDHDELYVTFTNPFLSDTDNDGYDDYSEYSQGYDANNYTNYPIGISNQPPTASNPIPADDSINIAKPPSSFSITINDPDNDKMNITWQTNQSGTWTTFNTSTNKTGGTYSVTNTSWVNQYSHKYYWRVTVDDGHDGSVTNWYSFTTKANTPPSFTDQNPANLSTGVSISLATWNTTIQDANGETFNWTIQTAPNVGSSSANGATNGSKSTNLAGLAYSTQYKVYVNATDGISWTRKWYRFTTTNAPGENTPPSVTSPYPANDSTGITIPLSYFRLTISDPNGDKMNITWQTNATGVWTTFNTTASQDNGTYYAYNTIWVNTYGKKYYWRTFVNDGHGGWNNQSYLMLTVRTETSPSVSSPIPTNGSTGVSKTLSSLSITISDAESDTMEITWQTNASGAWSTIDTSTNKLDGTYTTTATYWVNQYSHKYYWKALVKDEVNGWTNRTYYFTTLANVAPTVSSVYPTNHSTNIAKPPAYLSATIGDKYNDKMNITWRSNSTGIWKTLSTTTGVYNGTYQITNTSFANAFNTKYYWQTCIRDWYGMWKNTTYDFTTAQHTPPSITTYYPTTGTTLSGKSLSYISVSVNSSYGYTMNITWNALIGGIWTTLGTNESVPNGIYITRNTTFVSAYSTAYNWNVSIDDGHAVWTNESYSFTTGAAPGGGNGGGGGGGGYYVPPPTDNTATGTPSDTKKGIPGFEFIILFFALTLIILIRKYKRK